jgi:hypothetical protein
VLFALSRAHMGTAVLSIYTVRGQMVYSIEKKLGAQDKTLGWNYQNGTGHRVGSGIYLAALTYTNSSGAQETYKTAIALQK